MKPCLTRALPLGCAVAALLAAVPAAATDFPRRKSGLWEMKMEGMPGGMATCVDQASDDAMRGAAMKMEKDNCSKSEIKRESPTRVIVNSVCKMGSSTATIRTVATGDFSSSYVIESESKYDPPLAGQREGKTRLEARWTGPCKPGMKPGDMVLPNGMVVPGNMMGGMGGRPPAMPGK